MSQAKLFLTQLLDGAGIQINGNKPTDIHIHNDQLFPRVLREGSLGLGEAYMDGWWDATHMDELITQVFLSDIQKHLVTPQAALAYVSALLSNSGDKSKAFEIGERHYDIGNDLFEAMLDKRMVYTCGYWKKAKNLDQAQEAKLDLVCKKINLQPGQKILDIGCGWGSFAKFAAEKYGAVVVGITVSKEQVLLGKERCAGLPVDIRLQDYRDMNEQFDHIVSLGMFEHVGYKNYGTYMKMVARCLKDDGLFLLHTIGSNGSVTSTDPWIEKYIFPNSMLPSIEQIGRAIDDLFVMEDWHNFSADYDTTLMHWHKNVEKNWPKLQENYSERFHRMWTFYLLSCAGSFRSRKNQLWQIVLSKHGVKGGYTPIR